MSLRRASKMEQDSDLEDSGVASEETRDDSRVASEETRGHRTSRDEGLRKEVYLGIRGLGRSKRYAYTPCGCCLSRGGLQQMILSVLGAWPHNQCLP